MTQNQKLEITELVRGAIAALGSGEKAGVRCGCSGATISQVINGKWDAITDQMWHRIGTALGHRDRSWNIVPTQNSRTIEMVCGHAKTKSMWFAVSHRAGSGKTTALETFALANRASTFLIQAREWAKREFLLQLCRTLGIDTTYRMSLDELTQEVIVFFTSRPGSVLLIDEADKLKSPARRVLIPIYNACEGVMGVVIVGTDHLEKDLRNDVRLSRKGSDEIISRFGRKFIHLAGANERDVAAICQANGITDKKTIAKIFKEAEPVRRVTNEGGTMTQEEVVEDLRRVKRMVLREIFTKQEKTGEAIAA